MPKTLFLPTLITDTLLISSRDHSMHIARRHYLPAEVYQNARIFAALKRLNLQAINNV